MTPLAQSSLALSRGTVDRVTHRRADAEWLDAAWADPASRVLVEAVGDSQPVYYESMPEGEAGNRRAEIFFQG